MRLAEALPEQARDICFLVPLKKRGVFPCSKYNQTAAITLLAYRYIYTNRRESSRSSVNMNVELAPERKKNCW